MESEQFEIDDLDGYKFEELIAKIMKRKGYEKIKVTSKSRDVGKDIIMESQNGEIVVVECKHQKFVGRPVIQKLQGAMNHEEQKSKGKKIKGILVTSGNFSKEALEYAKEIGQEIELIDGKRLRNLCKELNIILLNGKVQIIVNKSFKNVDEKDSKDFSLKNYSKIYGGENHKPKITSNLTYNPACFISYKINFDTHTSVGCIDHYSNSGEIIIDGNSGKELDKIVSNFFFLGNKETEDIESDKSSKKIHFEFTENDIEEHALSLIIKEHTHTASYVGKNNVYYSKECVPKRRDIDIKQFYSVYLPQWENSIKINSFSYKQSFFVKENKRFLEKDELIVCKICENTKEGYESMSICLECGRIVCNQHSKIDYLDKKTPICKIHAKPFKLYLQKKYFAKKSNLEEYKKIWKSANIFKKIYEDKIMLSLIIGGAIILGAFVLSNI